MVGIKTARETSDTSFQQLRKLGLGARRIAEAVITTLNRDGSVNAAPMGIMLQPKNHVILIRPNINTRTFRNLVSRREAVINITSNPEVFFKTTFKEVLPGKQIPSSWVSCSRCVRVGRLRSADSWVEIVAKEHVVVGDRATISCTPLLIVPGSAVVRAYSRANSLAIESIIHATRIKWFKHRAENEKVRSLTRLISHYADIVRRVAANTAEERTMLALEKLIRSWNVEFDRSTDDL